MKYTKEKRLDIGRRIYDGEFSRYTAAEAYDINELTARNYMRMYRDVNHLLPKRDLRGFPRKVATTSPPARMGDYETMTKEEFIRELVRTRNIFTSTTRIPSGLNDLTALKSQHPEYTMVLHLDQGSVYASKILMSYSRCTTWSVPCLGPELQQITWLWRQSTTGSKQRYSLTST